MEIKAGNISKSYAGIDIIKQFTYHFTQDSITGIAGPNGSGKSTLLKILCGFLTPGSGAVEYFSAGQQVKRKDVFRYLTLAAPYSTVIKDFTLKENWDLLLTFKGSRETMNYKDLLNILEWKNPGDKKLSQFSSGMVQKVNLLLAMVGRSEILILDEPTSYLDAGNREWYHRMAQQFYSGRTVIIASNDAGDFLETSNIISL